MSLASIQEAAVQFANSILGDLNSAAAEAAGVDVLWFRLQPDHRSQDVIFQSYTLYGVEDCPLTIKAIYSDNNYDDAAITYNIMGINFAIPMTLDIALNTWKTATGDDGTIPQKGDIIFIPVSRKLMEVVSMQPVKSLGAQLTGYKVNLAIYTPTRNRIVGEQLKESIKENTTNLEEKFGDDIRNNINDIVDDNQLSIYTSTSQDKHKDVKPTVTQHSIIYEVRTIDSSILSVDGHTFSRSHYNVHTEDGLFVEYNGADSFTKKEWRCLSCWVCAHDNVDDSFKNIKSMNIVTNNEGTFIETQVGNKFKDGDDVIIKRGIISIPGKVVDRNTISVNGGLIKNIMKTVPNIQNLPGFTMYHDNVMNLIESESLSIKIKGRSFVSITTKDGERLVQIQSEIGTNRWYGIIVNLGTEMYVDVFSSENGLEKISSTSAKNDLYDKIDVEKYYITGSEERITNIRLYKKKNTDIDKQLIDLSSYNIENDSDALVNDSADVYLNKPYTGRQR